MRNSVVLIAEDAEDDFFMLRRAFERAGIEARLEWARNGEAAKAYLAGEASFEDRGEHPLPTVILADLKMPVMNGFELLSWVRSQPFLRRIPFVVLTGSDRSPDINRAYDLGASSYLVKPHGFEELHKVALSLKAYWIVLNQKPELVGQPPGVHPEKHL